MPRLAFVREQDNGIRGVPLGIADPRHCGGRIPISGAGILTGSPSDFEFRRFCALLCSALFVACGGSEGSGPRPVPTVSSVNPNNGPMMGGTSVVITGTNLLNVTTVTIGGGPLSNLSVVSGTQLTGRTAVSTSSGGKSVVVSSPIDGSGSCTLCFSYNPAPTVNSVSPNNGPLAGGTVLTITGADFPVTIDSVGIGAERLGNVLRVSSTQLTGALPPSRTVGTVDVSIYTTSAGSGTCSNCFTYNPLIWTSLSAGYGNTCGLTSGGAGYCWGENVAGGLGDGSTANRLSPVAVAGGLTFASLTTNERYACGLTNGGVAFCWGYNDVGQLGDGSRTNRASPVAVVGGLTFASVTTATVHTCGLNSAGAVFCWGRGYAFGDDDPASYRTSPVPAAVGYSFSMLAAGFEHTCGLTSGGSAYCWGYNSSGQLGDGSTTNRSSPVAVAGGLRFTSLISDEAHACGLTLSGAAYCWGNNFDGQLGDGSTTGRTTPVAVSGGITFAMLATGANHTCGLTPTGNAYCWGSSLYGALGDGSVRSPQSTVPRAVVGGLSFVRLTAGRTHTCALTSVGAAYCWGGNITGALGDGSGIDRGSPVRVANP